MTGNPPPAVTWARVKCDVLEPEVYTTRYDERAKEHVLEVRGQPWEHGLSLYPRNNVALELDMTFRSFRVT